MLGAWKAAYRKLDPSTASAFEFGLLVCHVLLLWDAARAGVDIVHGKAGCATPVFFLQRDVSTWGTVCLITVCAGSQLELARLNYIGLPHTVVGRLALLPFMLIANRALLAAFRATASALGRRWFRRGGAIAALDSRTCIICSLCRMSFVEPVLAPGCATHVFCRACLRGSRAQDATAPVPCPQCGAAAPLDSAPVFQPMVDHLARVLGPRAQRIGPTAGGVLYAATPLFFPSTGNATADSSIQAAIVAALLAPRWRTLVAVIATTRVLWWYPFAAIGPLLIGPG
eukprot:c21180_g1_i1.p1 GENE.c21180_g1_i1~~c21180_g1_i1.p1  ORF type:complete len:285 (+),score=17.52 c21180_g1_i1:41-895(+)